MEARKCSQHSTQSYSLNVMLYRRGSGYEAVTGRSSRLVFQLLNLLVTDLNTQRPYRYFQPQLSHDFTDVALFLCYIVTLIPSFQTAFTDLNLY